MGTASCSQYRIQLAHNSHTVNTDCEYGKTKQLIIRLIKTHFHRIHSPLRTCGKIRQHGVKKTHPIILELFKSASDNHGAYSLTVYAPAVMEPARTHTI